MSKTKTIIIIGIVAVLAITAGCSGPDVEKDKDPEPPGERIGDNIGDDGGTYRYVDNETGAVCYVVQNGGNDPAIDCIQNKTNE